MKFKEIKSHNIEDFTLEKERLIKKGWKCKSEQSYIDGFIIIYKAQFIKDKDKDFKTFLKELDDLVMSQHRRLMNITLGCEVDDAFNNQVNILKDIRNVIKKYKRKG